MKRLIIALCVMLVGMSVSAQYQLTNSDFEKWESVSYSGKTGEEPVDWSSFLDGTGSMKGMAGAVQLYKDTSVRPGSTGKYSAHINARSILGIVAQGNLTTGCVNMGSTSATDATGNYNYINEQRTDQSMRFTGHPDAAHFWVKHSGKNAGKVSILLTTKGYYQDPVANKITATLVAQSITNTSSNGTWTEYTTAFDVKDATQEPYYALVNVSTSATAGDGNASDNMYIDDLEMLYYSEASGITYDGQNILGKTKMNCLFDPAKLTDVQMTGRASTWSYNFDYNAYALTVTVMGENVGEDPTNVHTYTIPFTKPNADIASATQDGVDLLTNSESVVYNRDKVQLTFNSDVVSHTESFDIKTCQLTIVMTDNFGSKITRVIQFHVPNPQIVSATWNGETVDVNNFSTTDLYSESAFVLTPNADATLERSFDETSLLLTVKAKAVAGYEAFDRTYTYQFGLGQMPDPREEVIGPVAYEKGKSYYIMNKYHKMYVMDDNTLNSGENTTPTSWTVTDDNLIVSENSKYIDIDIHYRWGTIPSTGVDYYTNRSAGDKTTGSLDIQSSVDGYTFSYTASWWAAFMTRTQTSYLSWKENASGGPDGATSITAYGDGDQRNDLFKWYFYDVNEVQCHNLRIQLYDELVRAQQIGMDIVPYRQIIKYNNEDRDVLSDLLYEVRMEEFVFISENYTEDKTEELGSTDLTNTSFWTTDMSSNARDDQHWSGTAVPYYEQTEGLWDSSEPWTSGASQTLGLPAGYYVIRATARSSVQAISYLRAGKEQVTFPSKGDTGIGVDTEGNVNFDADGTYANSGKGFGWEYRYLAFTVQNPGDKVTIEIGGSCPGVANQWISISDMCLLAKPVPVMKMVSFSYEDKKYTPSVSGLINIPDVYYKEEIVPEIVTAGYGVYTCAFDSATWQMTVTLSQEEGINYGFSPKKYIIQFHKPAPGLASLVYDGKDILNAGSVDEYYSASKLAYSGNNDAQNIQLSFDRKTSVLTISISGYGITSSHVVNFKDASLVSTEFNEPIVVSIDGTAADPEQSIVYTRDNGDETFDFELPNFMLNIDGADTPIGTITMTGIVMQNNDGVNTFTKTQNVDIVAGDKEGISTDSWYGPWLGSIPVNLTIGEIYAGRLYCEMDVDMMESLGQKIHVTVGAKIITGINSIKGSNSSSGSNGLNDSYNMAGQRVGEGTHGIVIMNGRKVVR